MTPLIIELTYRLDPWSIGIYNKMIPTVRLVYFEADEDTGAKHVTNILEIDMEHMDPAFTALHVVDWSAPFDYIQFVYTNVISPFAEVQRADDTENGTAMRLTSYYLHMMKAHCLGYKDDEGTITKVRGENLFTAYMERTADDYHPYVAAVHKG